MDERKLLAILNTVATGDLPPGDAAERIKALTFKDLGFARVDLHRVHRKHFPEVIYCQGKTPAQVKRIADAMLEARQTVLATRASPEVFAELSRAHPGATYHDTAGIVTIGPPRQHLSPAPLAVVSAGTADLPVAEEAAVSASVMGNRVLRIYDVGVAGLHRLLDRCEELAEASVIIAVAGMDGALPAVLAGLTSAPVIAVPTSIGYGASFGGLAALLTMLNSCAPGVAVVNIDNGFGAAAFATLINARSVCAGEGRMPT